VKMPDCNIVTISQLNPKKSDLQNISDKLFLTVNELVKVQFAFRPNFKYIGEETHFGYLNARTRRVCARNRADLEPHAAACGSTLLLTLQKVWGLLEQSKNRHPCRDEVSQISHNWAITNLKKSTTAGEATGKCKRR